VPAELVAIERRVKFVLVARVDTVKMYWVVPVDKTAVPAPVALSGGKFGFPE
jgi:hypothetical protein